VIYRIYTEDKNRDQVEQIVGKYFDGFTIIEATGYWAGEREKSIIIEHVGAGGKLDRMAVTDLAYEIKGVNQQTAVLITCTQEFESKIV